jgi:hypothetical protein
MNTITKVLVWGAVIGLSGMVTLYLMLPDPDVRRR